ncbi:MAG: molybdopterin-guanine dinucleotide biosynthesis protein MobB [Oscillospiraceae bacterium]|nr:molybdopterin-guanine dinucleotide biosynthesis protein MobB [Oscillospiraceae bacterium]
MKVLSICGITKSGKTTTIENIIRELTARGYKVGSVKEIHNESFAIDPNPRSNTNRHRSVGARLVTARGNSETDILFQEKLPAHKILEFYEKDYDWVVMEGVSDICIPTIVTAHAEEDLSMKFTGMTFCVSGRISAEIEQYKGVPAIDATTEIKKLVDLIELRVYERLPSFPPQCCTACGMTCEEFAGAVLRGERRRVECVADKGIELLINGRRIDMVPFVQTILKNTVLGVVGALDGYIPEGEIEIRF